MPAATQSVGNRPLQRAVVALIAGDEHAGMRPQQIANQRIGQASRPSAAPPPTSGRAAIERPGPAMPTRAWRVSFGSGSAASVFGRSARASWQPLRGGRGQRMIGGPLAPGPTGPACGRCDREPASVRRRRPTAGRPSARLPVVCGQAQQAVAERGGGGVARKLTLQIIAGAADARIVDLFAGQGQQADAARLQMGQKLLARARTCCRNCSPRRAAADRRAGEPLRACADAVPARRLSAPARPRRSARSRNAFLRPRASRSASNRGRAVRCARAHGRGCVSSQSVARAIGLV